MSSLFNNVLTQQQKELLIVGYIHCKYNNHSIPNGLIKLFLQFLELSVKWNISGDELKQFLSAKTGEAMAGPSFIIKNIKFNLYLTPNGLIESEQGYVQFLVAPIFTSSKIDNVTLWYSLCCKQTNSEWTNTTIFYSSDNDCASWPVHTLPLTRITSKFAAKNTVNSSIQNKHHENGTNMFNNNQFECDFIVNNEDKLDFLCYIDIINIEYNDNGSKSYFHSTDVFMNKYAKFQWNIYDELLQDFRYCVWGKYFFRNINVNWMIECAPNGQSSEDEGNVNVLLSLLRLPNKIKSVLINMSLHCDYNDIQWDFQLKFDYDSNSYGWPDYTLSSSCFLSITSITFTLQINILQIYDKNDMKIPQYKWGEYGIIDNKNELEKEFDLEFKQRHKAKLQDIAKLDINDIIMMKMINDNNECNESKQSLYEKNRKKGLNGTELLVGLMWAASHGLNF